MTIDTQKSTEGVQQVFTSYMIMLLCGMFITFTAAIVAWSCNHFFPLTHPWIRFLEYVGYICWAATLGTLGPQAWSGNRSAERIDRKLVNILSLIGIFSFVMARELIPA
jgi:hypothetical protein